MVPTRDSKTRTMRSLLVPIAVTAMASIAILAGCPQERPGAEREIPPQRIPPALAVDPQPASPLAPVAADGGVSRRP
jgi:hypothetical protein